MTERGVTGEMNLDPIEPWGGFDLIQEFAARLMTGDRESRWIMVEEGEDPARYEQKIFRGWFESKGLL